MPGKKRQLVADENLPGLPAGLCYHHRHRRAGLVFGLHNHHPHRERGQRYRRWGNLHETRGQERGRQVPVPQSSDKIQGKLFNDILASYVEVEWIHVTYFYLFK